MFYAGIDVGGTSVKLGLFDADGETIQTGAVETVRSDPQAMANRIASGLAAWGLPIAAAGVSCAGRVNLKTGLVTASNLRWENVPFAAMLENALGCPVTMDNDASGALYGEWRKGACRHEKNVLYITLGTGVGGAFLIEGKPLRGHDNTGGEIGHIVTHADGLPCPCGGRGCFEQYASATALSRMGGGVPVPEIFARAAQGEQRMCETLDVYAHEMAIGIVNLVALLRFEVVVLGGGVSHAGDALLSRVREQVTYHCPTMPRQEKPRIVLASLGNAAGVIGAGMMALDQRAQGRRAE